MRFNSLQFGKAMSAALFVLLLVAVGTTNALAQTQVATLQHEDDLSVFYGGNAFVEAHTAAEAGDIITLSSGSFVPTTITKAITLRGAGCVSDTLMQTFPTSFSGQMTLNVTDTLGNTLNVEGINFLSKVSYNNLTNPVFTRCNFNEISYYSSSSGIINMRDAQFINCIINKGDFYRANRTTLINSVVWDGRFYSDETVVGVADYVFNSIVRAVNYVGSGNYRTFNAYNSIIIDGNSSSSCYFSNNCCFFYNCIGIDTGNSTNNPFGLNYTSNCSVYHSYSEVFESFNGTFNYSDEDELFILKDTIATGFLGIDGTQVGIHGGNVPYSSRPTYMVLKRCAVAPRSTIEGKLNVEIEVVTEEE